MLTILNSSTRYFITWWQWPIQDEVFQSSIGILTTSITISDGITPCCAANVTQLRKFNCHALCTRCRWVKREHWTASERHHHNDERIRKANRTSDIRMSVETVALIFLKGAAYCLWSLFEVLNAIPAENSNLLTCLLTDLFVSSTLITSPNKFIWYSALLSNVIQIWIN